MECAISCFYYNKQAEHQYWWDFPFTTSETSEVVAAGKDLSTVKIGSNLAWKSTSFFRYTLQLKKSSSKCLVPSFKRGFGELLGPTCQIKSWIELESQGWTTTGFSLGPRGWILGFPWPFCHRLVGQWLSKSWSLLVATWRSRLDMEHSGELGMMDQCDLHPKQLTSPVAINDSLTLFTPLFNFNSKSKLRLSKCLKCADHAGYLDSIAIHSPLQFSQWHSHLLTSELIVSGAKAAIAPG